MKPPSRKCKSDATEMSCVMDEPLGRFWFCPYCLKTETEDFFKWDSAKKTYTINEEANRGL